MPIRARWPPENWCGKRRISDPSSPTRVSCCATYSDCSPAATRPCATGASPTMSTTRMRGLSDAYGSWKIICILSCCRRAASGGSPASDAPCQRRSPAESGSRPTASRPSVDLPHPDSPTSPTTSPERIARSTPSTACTISSRRPAPSRLPMRAETSSDFTNRFDTRASSTSGGAAVARDAARFRVRSWRRRGGERVVAAHGPPVLAIGGTGRRRRGRITSTPAASPASSRRHRCTAAPVAKRATLRQVLDRRRHAGNLPEARAARAPRRHRVEQPLRVRMPRLTTARRTRCPARRCAPRT